MWKLIKNKVTDFLYLLGYIAKELFGDILDLFVRPKALLQLLFIILGYHIVFTKNMVNIKLTGIAILIVFMWKKAVEGDWKKNQRDRYKERAKKLQAP